jgi:lysophospholipase L1-like esterase
VAVIVSVGNSNTELDVTADPPSRLRRIGFRLAAVFLGLSFLPALELILAFVGWGDPQVAQDPFVGFRNTRPLFVQNAANDTYETAANRQNFFRPDSFPRVKRAREFRIFCLGGSTVQGRPFRTETSFTTWLELSLRAADPSRDWRVVNCGGISYASYRLVPILQEILNYQPDLVILYTGHNEFLEERSYSHIKQRPEFLSLAVDGAFRLRSVVVLRELLNQLSGQDQNVRQDRVLLAEEVQALLDYQGGLEQYHWDESWRRSVVEHFEFNLRRMVQICQQQDVPIWVADPVANLRDCPPFKSEHRTDLKEQELQQFDSLRSQAKSLYKSDIARATDLLEQAAEIDSQFAGLWFDLAKCYDALEMVERAGECYVQAKELDVCPLRILDSMHEVIRSVAEDNAIPLIPVQADFSARADDGIPGSFLLVDHVHPSILGHQFIANLFLDEFFAQELIVPQQNWAAERDKLFAQQMESLEDWYFLEGQQRLEAVQLWAQGRATRLPPTESPEANDESPAEAGK